MNPSASLCRNHARFSWLLLPQQRLLLLVVARLEACSGLPQ
jgi:hypothetical protein